MAPRSGLLPLAEAKLPLYAGVDLGGTNIKAALVDDEGRLVGEGDGERAREVHEKER